jgi:adenosylmethionine-8-amino-7-oxononanoate aminotransferase
MVALECVSDRGKKAPAAKETMQKVFDGAYADGAMIRISGNTIIISPPLVITSGDVERIAHALDAGFRAAA